MTQICAEINRLRRERENNHVELKSTQNQNNTFQMKRNVTLLSLNLETSTINGFINSKPFITNENESDDETDDYDD